MKSYRFAFAVIFALLGTGFTCPGTNEQSSKNKIKITGTVIAYDSLAHLALTTSVQMAELFIVKVESSSEKESRKFAKIHYTHWAEDRQLPMNMLDGSTKWSFQLTRNPRCDELMEDALQVEEDNLRTNRRGLTLNKVGKQTHLSKNLKLPCYNLSSGDFHRKAERSPT